ncbi:MAG: TrkH family potassium uptake protein [Erysipelotrichaceae bacterium]|nr:TrkH family potassium uptake protein [Erysipelotrichaceae bacterium]
MNKRFIFYLLGCVLCFEAAFLILPWIVSLVYGESEGWVYLACVVIYGLIGGSIALNKPKNTVFYAKDGFVATALSWILLSVAGAIPLCWCGDIPSYVDALFETISGFTTTGASILTNVEALSYTSLFWRSFTHWVGGMGVLVFILAIMPLAGGYNMHLMKAESPGMQVGKLVPRIRSTAMILYGIYLGMTVALIVVLLMADMPLFDALTLSFGTAGTGGFGIKNDSIASYTMLQQGIITVGMILFGVNFNAYYFILARKFKQAFKIEEVRAYFLIIALAIFLITLNTSGMYATMFEAFHHASFQVGTIITTTGYATVDFNQWPEFSKVILVALMMVGACAGSTGGGMKVSRILLYVKMSVKELRHLVHPRSINAVRLEGRAVDNAIIRTTSVYLASYVLIFFGSLLIISLDNFDFTTNFTAIAATINNIGPGLNVVGPTGNFSEFSVLSKFVMMFDMLAGRLELFPMLVLVSTIFQKRTGIWKGQSR